MIKRVEHSLPSIILVTILHLILVLPAMAGPFAARTSPGAPDETVRKQVSRSYWRLPLRFEANQGQTNGRVKFLSRGLGYNLFLTSEEAVFSLRSGKTPPIKGKSQKARNPESRRRATVFSIKFMGSNPAVQPKGVDELPIKTNYLVGNNSRNWRRDIPTYAKVEAKELYSHIDLLYYGNQRQLEFDFVVRPGGDYKSIRMKFKNVHHLNTDSKGNLVLSVTGGKVLLEKPIIYQLVDGKKHNVPGYYRLQAKNIVGFQVASYDPKIPLVIDPVLNYSTYLGGDFDDLGNGVAVDVFGNAYVTGTTQSTEFPTTTGAFQENQQSLQDAFVTKFNSDGSDLIYSTYLGGLLNDDSGNGIAVDSSGNAYITGTTQSATFPTTTGAFQENQQSFQDAFVTKLNNDGSDLIYSTYLGGLLNDDSGNGIAVDSSGNAYIAGTTQSATFPTTTGAFQENQRSLREAFVSKLETDGSDLVYSTYIGGSSDDFGNGIAVDSAGNTYVIGTTRSTDFPTQDPLQSILIGLQDAFVTKLNSAGSALTYSTYLGGDFDDIGNDITVDTSGNAYITGTTQSNDFPTENAFQQNRSSLRDAFVAKINPSGEAILYSTYIGGSADDLGNSVAVDREGKAYIVGTTESVDFPTTTGVFEENRPGAQDAFVSKLDPFGDTFLYSTYLGGTGDDFGNSIAVDTSGNAYVTGTTDSNNFPTTAGAFRETAVGNNDAFVTKLNPAGTAPLVYSTYLGGTSNDSGNSIAVDSSGNAYVTGTTDSNDFTTTAGAFRETAFGNNDAFVTKFNSAGSALTYSTYLGGTGDDFGNSIAVDTSDNAHVVGTTASNDFPTQSPFQGTNAGSSDAFVTKLNSAGTAPLVYSTYLGGSMDDLGNSIALDTSGDVYVVGTTLSDDFPVKNPLQPTRSGDNDAFLSKFNSAGFALDYSTYLGGSMDDFGNSVAVDVSDNAYVTGTTESDNFPTKDAFQTNRGGGRDGFITKVDAAGNTFVYSSYLGGNLDDFGNDVAIDGLGNAFAAGSTLSTNFRTKSVQDTPGGLTDGFLTKIQEAEGGSSTREGTGGGCFIATAANGS